MTPNQKTDMAIAAFWLLMLLANGIYELFFNKD